MLDNFMKSRVPPPPPQALVTGKDDGCPHPIEQKKTVQYEYNVTTPLNYIPDSGECSDCMETAHLHYVLRLLGDQGWELVHVVSPVQWVFKRPKR